jgi:hypothetical protein
MSIYADLVCERCSVSLFLGKQLWDGGDRVFGYWHGSAGDGKNWQSEEVMFSLFRFLAAHAGHPLRVLSESRLTEVEPFPETFFQREPTVDDLAGLSPGPGAAWLVSAGEDRGYALGRPLARDGAPYLFSGYPERRVRPRAFAPVWKLLARAHTGDRRLSVVTVAPAWLTSTVVSLARGIHQERAFDRMMLLMDALMDAGCSNEEVLGHCREPDHYLGCWLIDLLLNRS